MHSSTLVQCASFGCTLVPHHPGYTHPAPAVPPRPHGTGLSTHGARSGHWAQSWLHRWSDSLGMSPGPVLLHGLPADRHPLFATPCHPAVPLLVLNTVKFPAHTSILQTGQNSNKDSRLEAWLGHYGRIMAVLWLYMAVYGSKRAIRSLLY